jgi:hypothetical protein
MLLDQMPEMEGSELEVALQKDMTDDEVAAAAGWLLRQLRCDDAD